MWTITKNGNAYLGLDGPDMEEQGRHLVQILTNRNPQAKWALRWVA